ncbi:MAG: hypothetical protein ABJF65_00455 [Reichenbachiella sp.]|uniref:hypothetical protein n=1 Tax=Reichenbachiella sp. TaxID=2184521 RepID=UPI003265B9EB
MAGGKKQSGIKDKLRDVLQKRGEAEAKEKTKGSNDSDDKTEEVVSDEEKGEGSLGDPGSVEKDDKGVKETVVDKRKKDSKSEKKDNNREKKKGVSEVSNQLRSSLKDVQNKVAGIESLVENVVFTESDEKFIKYLRHEKPDIVKSKAVNIACYPHISNMYASLSQDLKEIYGITVPMKELMAEALRAHFRDIIQKNKAYIKLQGIKEEVRKAEEEKYG